MRKSRKLRKAFVVTFSVADRLLAAGQRLRADEAVTATTVGLRYAAARVRP